MAGRRAISTFSSRWREHRDLPARRPRSALPRAGLLRHRGAGRRASKCRPSTAAAPRSTIPEGTQPGRQFRLRGKGMPVLRGGGMHGDLYVEVAVETPVKLSKKQKELLREFEKRERGRLPTRRPKASWPRLKEFWNGAAKKA